MLRLSALARCHVGRVRPSVLRALLMAADLGKYYDRTLQIPLRTFTTYLPPDIRNDLPTLYKIK
jgi:hypothetical protein